MQGLCGERKHRENKQVLDPSESLGRIRAEGHVCFRPENGVVGIIMPISQVYRLALQDFTELPDQIHDGWAVSANEIMPVR